MPYQAIRVEQDPVDYFLKQRDGDPFLRIGDVVLREHKNPRHIFAHLISAATHSKWSHCALLYLTRDPGKGFENTFLVEAQTKGIEIASWRNEVVPYDEFTVGIKRPPLDWYMENPYEAARHDPHDIEDTHGIGYLRHVRGIAFDQVNGLYDTKTVLEMTALYAERAARHRLSGLPQIADLAEAIANFFKNWDARDTSETSILRFICSGLVQYSFFEALRRRIMTDWDIPAHREAAEHNLRHMQRIIFRPDPENIIPDYIQKIQNGTLDIYEPAPEDVLDFLKTCTPADFNNSPNLSWSYIVLKGKVWQINYVEEEIANQNDEQKEVLAMLSSEHYTS